LNSKNNHNVHWRRSANVQDGQLKIQENGLLAELDNDSADVTSEGRSFHVIAATTGKERLKTVDILTAALPDG